MSLLSRFLDLEKSDNTIVVRFRNYRSKRLDALVVFDLFVSGLARKSVRRELVKKVVHNRLDILSLP